jgi:hypothetical protein
LSSETRELVDVIRELAQGKAAYSSMFATSIAARTRGYHWSVAAEERYAALFGERADAGEAA